MRAIVASDIHLQAKSPVARSAEPDWFEAMARPLREIGALVAEYDVPVIYAGDIFDRWCAGPEVINFALRELPNGYAIPGQHDLPNHNYNDIERSAYWTLVEAGHLIDMPAGMETRVGFSLYAYAYPWGFPPTPIEPENGMLNIAVCHRFIYTKTTGYPGAPPTATVSAQAGALRGYAAAVFGDNHKGFQAATKGGPFVFNCGGLMRRKTDERDYKPGVGLLLSDGTIKRHYLDTTADKFIQETEAAKAVERLLDLSAFAHELEGLGAGDGLDFTEAVAAFVRANKLPPRVRDIITAACTDTIG